MNNNELVSIITPMYNSEKYIAEMIESVISQSYTNWELIIVDDCSNDNSVNIVNKFAINDKRIRLIKQDKNGGPSSARNRAINESNGKFLAFLDSDDIWINTKLEKQIRYMENNKVSITCTSYKIASEDMNIIYRDFIIPNIITYKMLLKQNYLSCDTVIIDKKYFKDLRIDNNAKHEDYIFWLKLIKEVECVHGIQECLAIYRVRENSRSSGKINSAIEIFNVYKTKENLGILKSYFYTLQYILRGVFKYRNIKK